MSRTLQLATRQALTAQETGELFLILLTIGEPAADPARLVNDAQDLVGRGQTFLAYPFEIDLPADEAETLKRVTLRIDNVARDLVALIRGTVAPPPVLIEVVRRAEPDIVEAGPFAMRCVGAQYEASAIALELGFEDVLNQRFPADDFSPADYPGLF